MHSVTKSFPTVKALDNVDFDLAYGEVHAIVGANGAGKSTLVKILGGHYRDYSGTVELDGRAIRILSPRISLRMGISTISQDINLVENLSISDNIFLGQEILSRRSFFFLDKKQMESESRSFLSEFGLHREPTTLVSSLAILEKRVVEIVKAFHRKARLLILDEPTAELAPTEITTLFQSINELKGKNISVIYISHRIEEIFTICDRVTVLRDGVKVFSTSTSSTSQSEIAAHMLGEKLTSYARVNTRTDFSPLLRVRDLRTSLLHGVSFDVGAGETIGIVNSPGNGASELVEVIFGKLKATSGNVYLGGERLLNPCPHAAIKNGIGFLPEDRNADGLFQNLSLRANIVMPYLEKLALFGFVRRKSVSDLTSKMINELAIKIAAFDPNIKELSGGNQQKALLARWLCNDATRVLLLEEPTKGVDIGSKTEIYEIIRQANQNKTTCLISSSDLDELLQLCHRIIIMQNGNIIKTLDNKNITRADLINLVMGQGYAN
jgi:ribose transport system ATP-binding protein